MSGRTVGQGIGNVAGNIGDGIGDVAGNVANGLAPVGEWLSFSSTVKSYSGYDLHLKDGQLWMLLEMLAEELEMLPEPLEMALLLLVSVIERSCQRNLIR